VISAQTLFQILCSAKEGTLQEAPFSSDGVMSNGKSRVNLKYDGYTMVLPAGVGFEDVGGRKYCFPKAIRISLPYKECVWNLWATAAARGEFSSENARDQERLLTRISALELCFSKVNNGVLQPLNADQLAQVHAVDCYLRHGEPIFGTGRMLAGMTEAILFNLPLFIVAWNELQSRREQDRQDRRGAATTTKSGTNASSQASARPGRPTYEPSDDFDPLFAEEEEVKL
jgi:hypothetical protein